MRPIPAPPPATGDPYASRLVLRDGPTAKVSTAAPHDRDRVLPVVDDCAVNTEQGGGRKAEERIGLVVMHLRRGPGLLGSRAGSIAAHVPRYAVRPVLALPGRPVSRHAKPRASSRTRARSSR